MTKEDNRSDAWPLVSGRSRVEDGSKIMTKEERDFRAMKRALSIINRADASDEEQLAALLEFSEIGSKYDVSIQQEARKNVLDALEGLRRLAGETPTPSSHEDSEVREQAIKMLKNYEELLFPPGKGA